MGTGTAPSVGEFIRRPFVYSRYPLNQCTCPHFTVIQMSPHPLVFRDASVGRLALLELLSFPFRAGSGSEASRAFQRGGGVSLRDRGCNVGNSNEPHEHLLFLFRTSESPCGDSSAQSGSSPCAREDVRTPGDRMKQGCHPLIHCGPCHQK